MMHEPIRYAPMAVDDYDAVIALWRGTEGVGLTSADAREPLAAYLARNPGFSQVAHCGEALVGAVLCGHDGRRACLYHLAVAQAFRGLGIGRELVARCIDSLATAGIERCNIFVFRANTTGQQFWVRQGWHPREDLVHLQCDIATMERGGH